MPLSSYLEIFPYHLMNWLYLLLEKWYLEQPVSWVSLVCCQNHLNNRICLDLNLFNSVNVVCFMTNVPSDSCSGIMVASFVWSNTTFSSFINLHANSVKYWLRLSGFWLIHFFGGSSIRWTVFHTSFGFREFSAFLRKEAFFNLIGFYKNFLQFGSSGKELGQNGSNHVILFVDYQGHFQP